MSLRPKKQRTHIKLMHCLNALSQSEKNDQNKVADLENMNSVSYEA
jgi:hypothetical protein